MASIRKRPDGRWRARYRDSSGKEHAKHFKRKVDAQRWLDKTTAAVISGTFVDPKAGRSTIGALAPTWVSIKSARVKAKSLAGYQDLLNVHVLPHWRGQAVSTITTADIEAWVAALTAKGLSASRTRQAYLVLKGILDTAVRPECWRLVPHSGSGCPASPKVVVATSRWRSSRPWPRPVANMVC